MKKVKKFKFIDLSDGFNDFIYELKDATYRRSIQVDVVTGKVIG